MISSFVFSQEDIEKLKLESDAFVKEGNDLFEEKKYADAEVMYKKALVKNPGNKKAIYNLGDAIFGQGRTKEAIAKFNSFNKLTDNKLEKAASFHNIGNAFMAEKDYQKAVEAYKNSLRNNPNDEETRYNLALAQKFLKENPPQNQNKDQDQNQNQDQNNENKQDQDENKKNEDNKDENKKDNEDNKDKKDENENKNKDEKDDKGDNEEKDENKDNKDQENKNDNKENQGEQQPQKGQLSPQQMKQLLDAMNNEENKTQKKINAKKAKGQKTNQEKDW